MLTPPSRTERAGPLGGEFQRDAFVGLNADGDAEGFRRQLSSMKDGVIIEGA